MKTPHPFHRRRETRRRDRALLDWARTHRLVVRDTLGRPIMDVTLDLIRPFTTGPVFELVPGLTIEAADAPAPPNRRLSAGFDRGPAPLAEVPPTQCRVMETRTCPPVYGQPGCTDRPCARFESEDPTPWRAHLGPDVCSLDGRREPCAGSNCRHPKAPTR